MPLPPLLRLSLREAAPTAAPLTRRQRREAANRPSPLLHESEDVLELIIEQLKKHLAPDYWTIENQTAESLCTAVGEACRGLAQLRRLPLAQSLAVTDCSDPMSPVWVAALIVFGLDGRQGLPLMDLRGQPTTHKANFIALCDVFRLDFKVWFDKDLPTLYYPNQVVFSNWNARQVLVWPLLFWSVRDYQEYPEFGYELEEVPDTGPTDAQILEFMWWARRPATWQHHIATGDELQPDVYPGQLVLTGERPLTRAQANKTKPVNPIWQDGMLIPDWLDDFMSNPSVQWLNTRDGFFAKLDRFECWQYRMLGKPIPKYESEA